MIFPVTNLKDYVAAEKRALAADMLRRAKHYLIHHWPTGYVCIALKYDVAKDNKFECAIAEDIIDSIRNVLGATPAGNAASILGWMKEHNVPVDALTFREEWIDHMIAELTN